MRTADEMEAELRELEQLYPPPTDAEYCEDWSWLAAESLSPSWDYWDVNVAAFHKQVVGVGPDYRELRIRLAKQFGVHPNRIVVSYFGEYERPWLDYA